jgi:flagellin-like hook-associated protein FlgL
MVSISTSAQTLYMQSLLASQNQELATLQDQISSGRKADTYAGLGGSATYSSLSLQSQANQLTAMQNNISAVTTVTTSMDSALSSITNAVSGTAGSQTNTGLVASLQAVTQSGDPGMAVFNTQASGMLSSIQSLLNTQVDGRYVFSGAATQTPPISNTSTLNNTVSSTLANYNSGTIDAAAVLSSLNTSGTSATATSAINAVTGTVTGLTVAVAGSGYTTPPAITISGGGGSGATATATVQNGVITGYTITNPGSGYTSPPTVTVAPSPAIATATASVAAGAVSSIAVTNAGTGYTYPPTITLTGGGGTGATATATVANGVITGYTITNAGTGYTSPPTVVIGTGMTESDLGYSSALAPAGNVSVRSDTNVDTDYTVKADNQAFQNVQKGLAIIANLKYNSSDSTGFYQIYNAAINLIQSGSSAVTQLQGQLGVASKSLTNTQTSLAASQTTLTSMISNVDDANVAQATTSLQNLDTQLQASYSIIAEVSQLSLVNYLNGTS